MTDCNTKPVVVLTTPTYWSDFYRQLQGEQWNKIKFEEVQYAFGINEWLIGDDMAEVNLNINVDTQIIGEP